MSIVDPGEVNHIIKELNPMDKPSSWNIRWGSDLLASDLGGSGVLVRKVPHCW
jgi:hypothetical protein